MELINIISQFILMDFESLKDIGYDFEPIEVYNKDNSNRIFARINLVNIKLERKIVFTIYPRDEIKLEIYITNISTGKSLDIRAYTEFRKGEEPRYVPAYSLNRENIEKSTYEVLAILHLLIDSDFKLLIEGLEWIDIPTYDPRDQSKYH